MTSSITLRVIAEYIFFASQQSQTGGRVTVIGSQAVCKPGTEVFNCCGPFVLQRLQVWNPVHRFEYVATAATWKEWTSLLEG